MNGQCEMEGCDHSSAVSVHAQWTLVDFIEYQACGACAGDMFDVLRRRRVDGQLPVDVWFTEYED